MAHGPLYYDAEAKAMRRRDKEMIPKGLLIAMGVMAASALGLATYASVTDRPLVGSPEAAAVVESRTFTLAGDGSAVTLTTPAGETILETDNGAFIAVVGDGLERVRTVHDIAGNPPVTVSRLANGRLVLQDPATGWRAELNSFGAGNARYWDVLFAE